MFKLKLLATANWRTLGHWDSTKKSSEVHEQFTENKGELPESK